MNRLNLGFIPAGLLLLALASCSSDPLLNIITTENEPSLSGSIATSGTTTAGLHDVATFDVYTENNMVHVLTGGKVSANNKHTVLRYFHSKDGGRNWSSPIALGDSLPTTIASRGNDIQIAVSGKHQLALWQTQGELPGMGALISAYSQDNGLTWQQGTNPAANKTGDQSHSDLIADKDGNFNAVWLEDPEENGYQSLRHSRSGDKGKHWEKAQTLDDSTCSCCWNTFALSSQGILNILYRDMVPRDMALLQSNDNAKTWQHLGKVGDFNWKFDGCPHTGGSLTYAGTNTTQMHSLVWTGIDPKSGLYYLSSNDNGVSWTIPKKLGNTAIHGDIAALDTNHIAAVWDEMEADGSSIFRATSEDGGSHWSTPKRTSKTGMPAAHPRLVATKYGYLALWTEKPPKQPVQLAWHFFK